MPNALQYRCKIFSGATRINADQNAVCFFANYLEILRNQTFLKNVIVQQPLERDNCWFLKNGKQVGKNETPFWRFSYEYPELKKKPKN